MKTLIASRHFFRLMLCSAIISAKPAAAFGEVVLADRPGLLNSPEKQACSRNLQRIYQAIQAYRKEHHQLPNWLSDLIPDYLNEPATLSCPVSGHDTNDTPVAQSIDPKLPNAYEYEFCDGPGNMSGMPAGMKMREVRGLQMGIVGGNIPLVRCLRHSPTLNISFDGRVFEAPLAWEDLYRDMVGPLDLQFPKLLVAYTNSSRPRVTSTAEKRSSTRSAGPDSLVGKAAPNFELELLDGSLFELAAQKGKNIVILDFWATWCGPCRAAFPGLIEVSNEFQGKGVILRAVDLRERPETVRTFLKNANLTFTAVMDQDGSAAELFRVGGIPHTVIVGKDGTIQAVHVGYDPGNKDRLRQELNDLLAGKTLAPQAR